METIDQYISALFAKLPATLEILRLKDTVLTQAHDSFTDLVADGASEHEAAGKVLASLGSIEDILARNGMQMPRPGSANPVGDAYEAEPLEDETEDYLDAQYNIARMNALGVGLCIVSPACPILFDSVPFFGYWLSESIGVVGMFGSVAIAVMLFIYASSLQKNWRSFPFSVYLTSGMREELRRRELDYAAQRTGHIALGVGLCIFSPAAPVLFQSGFGAALMFMMVAFGVYLMILSGVRIKSCRKLLRQS